MYYAIHFFFKIFSILFMYFYVAVCTYFSLRLFFDGGLSMFGKIIAVLLIIGLIAFTTYQVVLFVKQVKKRKKAKSDDKGVDDK